MDILRGHSPLFIIIKKVVKYLINITRKEAEYLRYKGLGRFVNMSSATHKSRSKRYWLTENPKALKQLKQYRENSVVEHHGGS